MISLRSISEGLVRSVNLCTYLSGPNWGWPIYLGNFINTSSRHCHVLLHGARSYPIQLHCTRARNMTKSIVRCINTCII